MVIAFVRAIEHRLRPRLRSSLLGACLVFALVLLPSVGVAQTYKVVPARAYLRASRETPPDAMVLVLSTLGFEPGDGMRLERLGDFRAGSPFQDVSISLGAVFSSSGTLLGPVEAHRIPGAIDAGADMVTSTTYYDALPTDIPEDFAVGDTVVQIPPGATHLFIAVLDSLYNDNTDPDGDFAVRISHAVLPSQVSSALRIWAGLDQATLQDMTDDDLVTGPPYGGIDIRDACRLIRQATGLEPNP